MFNINVVVLHPRGLGVSQYVVSVEFSSLNHHTCRPYSWFVCFLCWFFDGLENPHADQMFRTTAEAKSEDLKPVKHVKALLPPPPPPK